MIDTVKSQKTLKTFLSHLSVDRQSANKVRAILANRDDVKLVTAEIPEGDDRRARLSKQLRASDLFVALLSPSAVRNNWMLQELGAAWGTCKAIVPIKTQPDVKLPVSVDGLITFEIEEVLVEENWDRILAAFEGVREGRSFNFLTQHPLRSAS